MTTRHTVVKWDAARAAKAQVRLQAVARAAAMQARRAWLPVVDAPYELRRGARRPRAVDGRPGPSRRPAPALARPTVLVGPEGGWAPRS